MRENLFAAREFSSIADLNEQVRAWCNEIAAERRVPDAKQKTVAEAFLEEKTRLVELANDDFPVEERIEVRVGKTPYVRFDRNDYRVPHTHVTRRLTVLATDDRVRIVDPEKPTEVLGDHPRSFDRDQYSKTRSTRRFDVLLTLAALAFAAVVLIGAAARERGHEQKFVSVQPIPFLTRA